MSTATRSQPSRWTADEVAYLRARREAGASMEEIAAYLGRTVAACQVKASLKGIFKGVGEPPREGTSDPAAVRAAAFRFASSAPEAGPDRPDSTPEAVAPPADARPEPVPAPPLAAPLETAPAVPPPDELAAIRQALEELTARVAALEAGGPAVDRGGAEAEQLRRDLTQREAELAALWAEHGSLRQDFGAAAADAGVQRKEKEALAARLKSAEEAHDQLKATMMGTLQALAERDAQLAAARTLTQDQDRTLAGLRAELERVKGVAAARQSAAATTDAAVLQATIAQQQRAMQALQVQLADAQADRDSLRERVTELRQRARQDRRAPAVPVEIEAAAADRIVPRLQVLIAVLRKGLSRRRAVAYLGLAGEMHLERVMDKAAQAGLRLADPEIAGPEQDEREATGA